jgi:hypothetical protein
MVPLRNRTDEIGSRIRCKQRETRSIGQILDGTPCEAMRLLSRICDWWRRCAVGGRYNATPGEIAFAWTLRKMCGKHGGPKRTEPVPNDRTEVLQFPLTGEDYIEG